MISKNKKRIVVLVEKPIVRKLNQMAKRDRRTRSAIVEIALERLFEFSSPAKLHEQK